MCLTRDALVSSLSHDCACMYMYVCMYCLPRLNQEKTPKIFHGQSKNWRVCMYVRILIIIVAVLSRVQHTHKNTWVPGLIQRYFMLARRGPLRSRARRPTCHTWRHGAVL